MDAPDDSRVLARSPAPEVAGQTLRRIIFLTDDSSTIGGIPSRTRKTMARTPGRNVQYVNIASRKTEHRDVVGLIDYSRQPEAAFDLLDEADPHDTVVFTPNNVIRRFDGAFRRRIVAFPLVHVFSGQLAFTVQDQPFLADLDYVDRYRVTTILSFSDLDIAFQRQLGTYGQIKGWLPCDTRERNDYADHADRQVGYVGRIDFHSKACDRLVDIAEAMRAVGLGPIRLFTTRSWNSPHYDLLMDDIARRGLTEMFDVRLGCEDRDEIYRSISILLLPSRKESFGQVILEAFSYGIPVIAASYAPGPSELIRTDQNGILLDDYTPEAVVGALRRAGSIQDRLSAGAFESHRSYTWEGHLELLEDVARRTLARFDGENRVRPFPALKIAQEKAEAETALRAARAEIEALRRSTSWRITAPIRWAARQFGR